MKISSISVTHPEGNHKVTPELLASVLAKYSRSNLGIDKIMESVDLSDPDASVDKIFRHVDYGHASITGLTGGIPMVIDDCSMLLAYKLFEHSQMCDGQESSTRYIRMEKSNVLDKNLLSNTDIEDWSSFIGEAFSLYETCFELMDKKIKENPDLLPRKEGISDKVRERFLKNYALDRVRYFIPFATLTNVALIMTARSWCETIRIIDSYPLDEFHECAKNLRTELSKFAPRMIKHSFPTKSTTEQIRLDFEEAYSFITYSEAPQNKINVPDQGSINIMRGNIDWYGDERYTTNRLTSSAAGKENRYAYYGKSLKRCAVNMRLNNISIAELRDLNRHRPGYRSSDLAPIGYYLPKDLIGLVDNQLMGRIENFINKQAETIFNKAKKSDPSYLYYLTLGNQVGFEKVTTLDKLIYEIELRTGLGAHFRYCEHYSKIYNLLVNSKCFTDEESQYLKDTIILGSAEPEM